MVVHVRYDLVFPGGPCLSCAGPLLGCEALMVSRAEHDRSKCETLIPHRTDPRSSPTRSVGIAQRVSKYAVTLAVWLLYGISVQLSEVKGSVAAPKKGPNYEGARQRRKSSPSAASNL